MCLWSMYGKFHNNLPLSPHLGPHFVAVNNKNEIIVTDFHNHSVKVRHALSRAQKDYFWKSPQEECADVIFIHFLKIDVFSM